MNLYSYETLMLLFCYSYVALMLLLTKLDAGPL